MPPRYAIPMGVPDFDSVWNLLFYNNFAQSQTDSQLVPVNSSPIIPFGNPKVSLSGSLGSAIAEFGVTVIQFGTQSGGYWVMVTCPQADPTSFSARLALQFFIGPAFLNFVNSTFIQDLENLTVTGYFSDGLPLP